MKKIRLGNDIQFNWSLFNSEGEPYNIEGADLRITYTTFRGVTEVTDFSVSGNVVSWIFKGKDQKVLGDYIITLQKNAGEDGMITIDKCSAFRLVARSCDTGGEDTCSHLKVETVELQSEVDGVIVDPVIPEIGENGNWFVNGKDTGKPSKGEDGKAFTYDDFTPEQIEELQKPATDAADSLLRLEKAIESAEQSRILAENNRNESELLREQSELVREQAETERSSAETKREENESKRLTAEQARIQAESARSVAEQDRVSKEQSRVSAEEDRVADETKRSEAESQRAQAETKRAEAETARVLAETKRSEAEASRVSAETARVSAEETRVTEFEQLKQDSQTAIDNANKSATSANDAANKANEAAESVESRLSQVYANYDAIVSSGETDQNKIYIDGETNTSYRYDGAGFVGIGGNNGKSCNGILITDGTMALSDSEIDYINSIDSISLMWFTRTTYNATDWYRYLAVCRAEKQVTENDILKLGYDGGFIIFDSRGNVNPDFNYKVRGYRNIVSINRKEGIAIGYDDMGLIFNQQLERFKRDYFINKEKYNSIYIDEGDRKNIFYEWTLFNFDASRIISFNPNILSLLRNRIKADGLPSNFIHKDYDKKVIEKPKPIYKVLTLEQDSDGYWHQKAEEIPSEKFGINSRLGENYIYLGKALRNIFSFEILEGSCLISEVDVLQSETNKTGKLISIKNIETGEEKNKNDELGIGKWEVIVDFYAYTNYPVMGIVLTAPFDLKLIEEKVEPYAAIIHLKFDKFYDGKIFDDSITGKRTIIGTKIVKGPERFDETTFNTVAPNRTPRFIGEKWYNTATGDIYEAGDLTSFKKNKFIILCTKNIKTNTQNGSMKKGTTYQVA